MTTADNVTNKRRASDRQTEARAVLPGGCILVPFPGCAVPVVNKPRRGRLPASVPSLSRARAEREQRAEEFRRRVEELQRREKHLAEIDAVLRVAENCLNMARAELEKVGKPGAAPWSTGRTAHTAG